VKPMPRFILLSLVLLLQLTACGQPQTQQVAATPSPAPTATLMPGWKRFENKGVVLAMPDTFVGGDLTADDQQTIIENLKKLGSDFAQIAEIMKRNPDIYVLFIIDAEPTAAGMFTNVNVAREKVVSAIDVDAYVSAVKKQLPGAFKIKSQDDVTLLGEPAARLIIEATINGTDIRQAMYIVKDGKYMYAITFATDSDAFEEKQPMFEQSIQSLAVNPEP
jgi:hypothetical protein